MKTDPIEPDTPPPAKNAKRVRSWGETVFDLGTYGGITWILNEIISAWAGGKIQGEVKDSAGHIVQKAGAHNAAFNEKVLGFKGLLNIPKEKFPRLIDRPLKILYLCIGGTAVVPLVKYLEDRKGKIVEAVDNTIYGHERIKSDPVLIEAHKEMSELPKQTWGSLFEGRLVVMATAIGLDSLVGHDKAPITKLFENSSARNYANMERAGTTIARDVLSKIHPSSEIRENIAKMRKSNPPYITMKEGKAAQFAGGTFGFVTILSAALTVLFYASSKLFARKHEERVEIKQERRMQRMSALTNEAPEPQSAIMAEETENVPTTRIQSAESISKMTPELSQAYQPALGGA